MKNLLALFSLLIFHSFTFAQAEDPIEMDDATYELLMDSIENSFNYEYHQVLLKDDLATLNIPEGYKFLGPEQSLYVLSELWGNPPAEVLGLLFPEETSPMSDNFTFAVEVTYSEEGYIDDNDADGIDYDDLLEEMQNSAEEESTERIEAGYENHRISRMGIRAVFMIKPIKNFTGLKN